MSPFSFGVFPTTVPDPPKIDRGARTVKILVGTENDQQEFIIHKDLLCASSKFFEKAFSGPFVEGNTQEMKLPEEEPTVFAFLCDWLYTGRLGPSNMAYMVARQLWNEDSFWLKVYGMADRIMSPGLQVVAYACLTKLFDQYDATVPSREFVYSLFTEDAPLAMQMHVIEHVAYWLPKSQNKEDWAQLFSIHERFGMEMALAMVRSQSKASEFIHPAKQDRFAEKHGFNVPELQAQARSADKEPAKGAVKLLHKATLGK